MNFEYKITPEGCKILYVQDQKSPSIEVGIYFATGSRSDYKNKLGIAHLLEHLNFQGTIARPLNKQIVLEIESLGGHFDAFTGNEYTGYVIKAPAAKLAKVIDVLADLVFNSVLTDDQKEKEINVIIEEIKMYDDMPSEKVKGIFQKQLFPDNNLGEDIAGTPENLANISREDLLKFRDDNYTLDNMLISIAGNFDIPATQILVDQILKSPGINAKKSVVLESSRQVIAKKVINIAQTTAQTNLILGGYGLPRNADNRYEIKLGNIILSGGMGSLLFQRLREELRLVYYAHMSHAAFQETGIFQVEMGVDNTKIKQAVDEAINCLKDFVAGNFSDIDFDRAKNYLTGLTLTQIESSMDLASWNALRLLNDDSAKLENNADIIKAVNKLTKEDVLHVWQKILIPDNMLICNLGPKELVL